MNKSTQIVRSELNLTKHFDFVFSANKLARVKPVRSKEWQIRDEDNKLLQSCSLTIASPDFSLGFGPLTSRTGQVYLALLIKIQAENISALEPVEISLREICRIMGKSWNGRVSQEIAEELRAMKSNNLTWFQSFTYKKKGRAGTSLTDMSIITRLIFKSKATNTQKEVFFQGADTVVVRFDEMIAENIKDNHCIPINYKVYQDLNPFPTIQAFYIKIGFYQASHGYKIQELSASKILFKILDINASRYLNSRGKSKRKEFLEQIVKHLNSRLLSSRHTLNLSIKPTVDNKDYKLVIRCDKSQQNNHRRFLPVINSESQIKDLVYRICNNTLDANNLNDKKTIERYCQIYPLNMMNRALGEYKESHEYNQRIGKTIESKQSYFASIVHTLAHEYGYDWVKDCGLSCKHKNKSK